MTRRSSLVLPVLLTLLSACGDTGLEGLRPILTLKTPPPMDSAGHYLLDFGDVAIGSGKDLPLTALNTGRLKLTLQPASVTAPFSADLKIIATLQPQAQEPLGFTFTPTTLGAARQTVVLHSDGGTVTVDLDANGVPAPMKPCSVEVNPKQLDFGNIAVGQSKTLQALVTNSGGENCTLSTVQLTATSDPAFSLTPGQTFPTSLTPTSGFRIGVIFAPTAGGTAFTGNVAFTAGAPTTPISVPLTGSSTAGCKVTVSPLFVDFANINPGQTETKTVVVTDISGGSCDLSGVQLAAGSDASFSLVSGQPTSATLTATNTVFQIGVVFSPTAVSAMLVGNLTFVVGLPDSTVNVPLTASSGTPCPNPEPDGSCPVAMEPIYINSATSLYSFDPTTHLSSHIANFNDPAGDSFAMVDIAIDNNGILMGVSGSVLYAINPTTGVCTEMVSLGSIPDGLTILPDNRIVVAGGEVDILDRNSYAVTVLVPYGSPYSTSGDIVALPDGLLYWSVFGSGTNDALVTIDPTTHVVTPVGTMVAGEVYGLAYANNMLFGFTGNGDYLVIDPTTASGTMGPVAGNWYGATSNPTTWP